jgi:hypothetical protein
MPLGSYCGNCWRLAPLLSWHRQRPFRTVSVFVRRGAREYTLEVLKRRNASLRGFSSLIPAASDEANIISSSCPHIPLVMLITKNNTRSNSQNGIVQYEGVLTVLPTPQARRVGQVMISEHDDT